MRVTAEFEVLVPFTGDERELDDVYADLEHVAHTNGLALLGVITDGADD